MPANTCWSRSAACKGRGASAPRQAMAAAAKPRGRAWRSARPPPNPRGATASPRPPASIRTRAASTRPRAQHHRPRCPRGHDPLLPPPRGALSRADARFCPWARHDGRTAAGARPTSGGSRAPSDCETLDDEVLAAPAHCFDPLSLQAPTGADRTSASPSPRARAPRRSRRPSTPRQDASRLSRPQEAPASPQS